MKIICIDHNYPGQEKNACAAEAGTPTLYLKPETALSRSDWPVFVPDWSNELTYEVGLMVRINRLGKSIPERFAHRYYDEVTLATSFTARDVLRHLQAQGGPWEVARGFDGSIYCGQTWLRLSELAKAEGNDHDDETGKADARELSFDVQRNDDPILHACTADMLHTLDAIIAYASRYYLLKTGDLIFTGSPCDSGRIAEGDVVTGWLQGREVMCCRCK